MHPWDFCPGSSPAIGMHLLRVVICIEVAGMGCETQPRHKLPPLTLCPVCDLPKRTSEVSSPSNFRSGGKLAPARAITVGKMSSELQKEQDTVCLGFSNSFPSPSPDPNLPAPDQGKSRLPLLKPTLSISLWSSS